MRDRRSIWLVLVVVASSVLVGGSACGHGAGTTASEELIRLAKGSEESLVRSLIGKEATARGTNADEAANLWVTRFTSAHVAYQEISPHARAVGCEAVTSWLGALATPTTIWRDWRRRGKPVTLRWIKGILDSPFVLLLQ